MSVPSGLKMSTKPLPAPASIIFVVGRELFRERDVQVAVDRLRCRTGAKPAGIVASLKLFTKLKFLSNTSTVPAWKFVRYRKFAPPVWAIAIALYTAPLVERSATIEAAVPEAAFHAEMVPSSPAKMNSAGPPFAMLKSVVELKICPVGTPVWPAAAAGIVTVSDCLVPSCA